MSPKVAPGFKHKDEVVAFRLTTDDAVTLDQFVSELGAPSTRSKALRLLVIHALKCKSLRDEVRSKGVSR